MASKRAGRNLQPGWGTTHVSNPEVQRVYRKVADYALVDTRETPRYGTQRTYRLYLECGHVTNQFTFTAGPRPSSIEQETEAPRICVECTKQAIA